MMDKYWVAQWALVLGALNWAACASVDPHLQRGDQLLAGGLHEEALAEYEAAHQKNPNDPAIAQKMDQTRRAAAEAAFESGRLFLESGDFASAVGALQKAIQWQPQEKRYAQALEDAAAKPLAKAKELAEKNPAEAVKILDEVLAVLPRHGLARALRAEIQRKEAATRLEQASRLLDRGLAGNALLSALSLRRLFPEADTSALEAQAREKLADRARFSLTLRAADSPRKHRDLTEALLTRLRSVRPQRCLSFAPAEGPGSRAVLWAGVEKTSFEQKKELTTGKQSYQSGTRKVDNPRFLELEQQQKAARGRIQELDTLIRDGEAGLEAVRQRFADAGPDDDEAALRAAVKKAEAAQQALIQEKAKLEDEVLERVKELSRTKRKLDEPVMDEHVYDVQRVRRTAVVLARAAVIGEGKNLLARRELRGEASVEDDTHPAQPKYGVKADPLRFEKDDTELVAEAVADAARRAADVVEDACRKFYEDLREGGRQAEEASPQEAVEAYVLVLLISPDAASEELKRFLRKRFDLDDKALEMLRPAAAAKARPPEAPPAE